MPKASASDGPVEVELASANRWFGRRSFRLTEGLNNRLEREVWIVAASPLAAVRRHFDRLRFWRIETSNAEVFAWTATDLIMIALTLATLLRLTVSGTNTAGAIYAVLAYVFAIHESVETLPALAQNIGRARDIVGRVAGRQ